MRLFDTIFQHLRLPAASALVVGVAALLLGLWLLAPVVAVAQAQIDQVQPTTQQVEGTSQSQIFVAQDEGGVPDQFKDDVTDLIPTDAPGITDADGNNATVFQDGNRNNVSIRQAGTNNQASASQLGDDNRIVITQGGVDPVFGNGFSDGVSAGDVFEQVQSIRPTSAGSGNLAVAVHDGSDNRTSITQLGSNNAAGIRLGRDDQIVNLIQNGNRNRYLMDTRGIDELDDLSLRTNVVQNGNDNSLETNTPVDVQMNGSGIEMVVLRGTPLPANLDF